MKLSEQRILSILLLCILTLSALITTKNTYSYWADDLISLSINLYPNGVIGSWRVDDNMTVPPSKLKPPFGAKVIPSPEGNLNFSPYDVVYYNGELILITGWGVSEKDLFKNAPNYSTRFLGWQWQPNQIYNQNSVIFHNKKLYIGTANTGNLVGESNHPEKAQYWTPVGHIEWIPGKTYREKSFGSEHIIEYNGDLYKIKWHLNGTTTPPPMLKQLDHLGNPMFISGSNYSKGSVVRHNGGVYQSLINTNIPPETEKGHWKRLDSPQWSPYHIYKLHDVVTYQGNIYQAVNVELANQNAPTTINYAWNHINTYYYIPANLYSKDDVVVQDEELFRSLQDNNTEPLNNTNAWLSYGSKPVSTGKYALGISLGASGEVGI